MAMNKQQVLEFVIDSVRRLHINEIVGMYVKLIWKGSHFHGLCPFHNDHKMGSFVVSPKKNIFKCFSCGEGGDGISFVAKLEGINYVASAFKIALDFGIISNKEYEEYYKKRRYSKKEVSNIEKKYQELDKEKFESNIAEPAILDKVFNIFLDMCELSDSHKEHLLKVRNLTEEQIEEKRYKTFPSRYIIRKFIKRIREEFGSEEVLENIPGFYQEEKKVPVKKDGEDVLDKEGNKIYEYVWLWTFAKHSGIIIPIKNAFGQIIGLQIRRDEEEEDKSRYVWFSSSFASFSDEKYKKGTSSGSPIDVVYPKEIRNQAIFITEGRFKAEKIAETYNSIAISVQGVGTWKGILNTIEDIVNSPITKELSIGSKYEVEIVYLAFDADLNYKPQVWQQAKKMSSHLQQGNYPIYYLNWNEDLGKGIDDLLIAGHLNKIQKYDKEKWDKRYEFIIDTVLEETGIPRIQDVSSDIFKEYFHKYMNITPLKRGEISEKHKEIQDMKRREMKAI